MNLVLTNIEWDVDDARELEYLPQTVVVLDADPVAWPQEPYQEILGDALSDAFGYAHHGFSVYELHMSDYHNSLYPAGVFQAPQGETKKVHVTGCAV